MTGVQTCALPICWTENVRLAIERNSGNVGIGTTTPYAKLSVAGNTALDSNIINFASSTASTLTFNYLSSATSTILDLTNYSWSIATGTAAAPIFTIDTRGSKATSTFTGGFVLDNGKFKYDYGAGTVSIPKLDLGNISFEDNAGTVSWADLAVTSSAPAGTKESYTAQIDSTPLLTIYAE